MYYKKFMLFLIFLIVISLSVTCVSANENNTIEKDELSVFEENLNVESSEISNSDISSSKNVEQIKSSKISNKKDNQLTSLKEDPFLNVTTTVDKVTTINVKVNESATGNVSFKISGPSSSEHIIPVFNGISSLTLSGLIPGEYSAFVLYSGDDVYQSSNLTFSFNVSKRVTFIHVSTNIGDGVGTITARLNESATGYVTFEINGEITQNISVSKGVAVCSLSGLTPGNYTAYIRYLGNDIYESIYVVSSFTVPKKATSLHISSKLNGNSVTITSNIGKDVTGKISFKVLSTGKSAVVDIENGVAVCKFDNLKFGDNDIEVTYLGNSIYNSNHVKTTVKIKQFIKYKSNILNTEYKSSQPILLTLKKSDGSLAKNTVVTVKFLGKTYKYKTNSNGKLKIYVDKLTPKKYSISFVVGADSNYYKSTFNAKFIVSKTNVKIFANKKTFKTNVKVKKYSITLKNNKNKIMKNVKLTLKINGKTFKATTNSNGKATFKITNLKQKGSFGGIITFGGNKFYSKCYKTTKIITK